MHCVDLRSEPRFEVNQPVTATVIGKDVDRIPARILNLSGKGMRVSIDRRLPVGAAVKIEWRDTLLLCEVCYCCPEGELFSAGLQVEHALFHTMELASL